MTLVPTMIEGKPIPRITSWCRVSPRAFVFGCDVGWSSKMPSPKHAIAKVCSGGCAANKPSFDGLFDSTRIQVPIVNVPRDANVTYNPILSPFRSSFTGVELPPRSASTPPGPPPKLSSADISSGSNLRPTFGSSTYGEGDGESDR